MAIELICSCGKRLTADLTLAGKGMTCPACNALIAAPAEEIPELEVQIVEEDQVLDILEVVDEEAEESGCYSYQDTGNVEEDSASSARVFEGEAGTIRLRESAASLAYSPNDRWALAGVDMDIQVLDMKNHKRAFKFCKHEDKVTSMCFTPDSRGVVSADESGRMLYWDLDERDVIRRFKGVGAAAIAISPLGRYAVTGGEDGRTRFWELDSGNEYDLDKANWDHEVRCVRFSPDGRFVAAGGRGARCAVWSVETGERLTRLQGASGTVESLSFSSEGDFLTGCGIGHGAKCTAWQWQLPEGNSLACWETPSKHDCPISINAVVPEGNYLVSVGQVPKEQSRCMGPANMAAPGGSPVVDLITAGAHLYMLAKDLTPSKDFRLQVWNVKSGVRARNVLFKGEEPLALAVSPKGTRALLATAKGGLHIFGLGQI